MSVNLTEKAMLVRLSVSQWTARKYDRNVSETAAKQFHTDSVKSGRYNKILIAEGAIQTIQKIVTEARTYHYENTMPWGNDDFRMLPATNYFEYSKHMRGFRQMFEEVVARFLKEYPVLVEEAKIRLNGMFNEKDYPKIEEIPKKYGFAFEIMPLPNAPDFRVALNDEEVNTIKADIEKRMTDAQTNAMNDLWTRLYDSVKHMADRLATPDAVFRDSLVTNLVDLCELLPRMNVLGDAGLESMRQEVESKLCSYEADNLRENKTERRHAAEEAKKLLGALSAHTKKDRK